MVAQRQLEDTVLIVVKWGFESLVSSHRLLLDLVGGITMPLRCFYSVCCLSVKTGSYLVSRLHLDYVLIMFCITKVQSACEDRLHNTDL